MKIEHVEIKNFRCFKDYTMELAPKITVLIGHTGSGKNSLLRAIAHAVSFILAPSKHPNKDKSLDTSNGSCGMLHIPIQDFWHDKETHTPTEFVSIKATGTFEDKQLSWEFKSTALQHPQTQTTLYHKAYKTVWEQVQKTKTIPLLAYYSEAYPQPPDTATVPGDKILNGKSANLRNFGHVHWDNQDTYTPIWQTRFLLCYMNWFKTETKWRMLIYETRKVISHEFCEINDVMGLKAEKERLRKMALKEQKEWKAISDCLRDFSRSSRGFSVSPYKVKSVMVENKQLTADLGDKPPITFADLPIAYKRLYYILFDIAYRSYALNGNMCSPGIVMIDRIDLHLTELFQQDILRLLKKTFPRIQFIVTTQSPHIATPLNREMMVEDKLIHRLYRIEKDQIAPELMLDKMYSLKKLQF